MLVMLHSALSSELTFKLTFRSQLASPSSSIHAALHASDFWDHFFAWLLNLRGKTSQKANNLFFRIGKTSLFSTWENPLL